MLLRIKREENESTSILDKYFNLCDSGTLILNNISKYCQYQFPRVFTFFDMKNQDCINLRFLFLNNDNNLKLDVDYGINFL